MLPFHSSYLLLDLGPHLALIVFETLTRLLPDTLCCVYTLVLACRFHPLGLVFCLKSSRLLLVLLLLDKFVYTIVLKWIARQSSRLLLI